MESDINNDVDSDGNFVLMMMLYCLLDFVLNIHLSGVVIIFVMMMMMILIMRTMMVVGNDYNDDEDGNFYYDDDDDDDQDNDDDQKANLTLTSCGLVSPSTL